MPTHCALKLVADLSFDPFERRTDSKNKEPGNAAKVADNAPPTLKGGIKITPEELARRHALAATGIYDNEERTDPSADPGEDDTVYGPANGQSYVTVRSGGPSAINMSDTGLVEASVGGDRNSRSAEFLSCVRSSGLDWLLQNPHFADNSATFVNRVAAVENTDPGLLGFTFQHEGAFRMHSRPNTNGGAPDPRDWDWGPFQMNYRQTIADIKVGSYPVGDGVTITGAFGAIHQARMLGVLTSNSLDQLQNGRLAARKLNWLVNASKGDYGLAAARFTRWTGKRFSERLNQWRIEGKSFQDFFSCFKKR